VLDRRLFGSFLEHLGRAVYGGIFEPSSPLSDVTGFRNDVADCIQHMNVPIVRYPGGNFVSGYNWLDGVGPVDERPSFLDKAWNSTETNRFGTNEFMQWCKKVGTEPMLALNLGTGTPEMAAAWVDYCNTAAGTRWSDLRREHGYENPHGVRYWCLGNEIDGPWQQGHKTAEDYGRLAAETCRAVRAVDTSVELIAAGSSNTQLSSYLGWDRTVLEQCYDEVDAISLHNYYGNTEEWTGNDSSRYLAMNLDMERQINEVAAVCDQVRKQRGSTRSLWLSFDEWNVWYRTHNESFMDGHEQIAPPLLEEEYNLEDALLVGGLINTLLRHSDRVRIACLAQLVNVIAPIMTQPDAVLLQSIYYPYYWALKFARGRVLDVFLEGGSYPIKADGLRHDFAREADVPYIDVAATVDDDSQQASVFILNRDLNQERELVLDWKNLTPGEVIGCQVLTGPDLKVCNTFEHPDRVRPQTMDHPVPGDSMTLSLPSASYTVLNIALH